MVEASDFRSTRGEDRGWGAVVWLFANRNCRMPWQLRIQPANQFNRSPPGTLMARLSVSPCETALLLRCGPCVSINPSLAATYTPYNARVAGMNSAVGKSHARPHTSARVSSEQLRQRDPVPTPDLPRRIPVHRGLSSQRELYVSGRVWRIAECKR